MDLYESIRDEEGISGCSPVMCCLSINEALELAEKLRKAAANAKNMTPEYKKWIKNVTKKIKKK
jgi:hypothetical protein